MQTLKGITWDHPRGYAPLEATAIMFTRQHPRTMIHWDRRSLQAFGDQSLSELAEAYDLLVVDHPHVGEAAESRALLPLESLGRDTYLRALQEQSAGDSFTSYTYEGGQWALPIDAAVHVAAYRPDLLDTPPASWEDCLELAREGKVLWAGRPIDAAMTFFSMSAALGIPFPTDPDEEFAQDHVEAVLLKMKTLGDCTAMTSLRSSPIDVLESMSTGDAYLYCPYLFGYVNYVYPTPWKRSIAYTDSPVLSPDHPPRGILGGTGIAISARCRDRGLAADYAFWIAGAICQRNEYLANQGQPANAAAWNDPALDALTRGFFSSTGPALRRAYLRPRYNGYVAFQRAAGEMIHTYLRGGATLVTTIQQLRKAHQASREKSESLACH